MFRRKKYILISLALCVSVIVAMDTFVYPFTLLVRYKISPDFLKKAYEPKEDIFDKIRSGISFEELKSFFPEEQVSAIEDHEQYINFIDVKVSGCSHFGYIGDCNFTFFNNRLGKVYFIPQDEVKYEEWIRSHFKIKEIQDSKSYFLNSNLLLKRRKSNVGAKHEYKWADNRYIREETVFLD